MRRWLAGPDARRLPRHVARSFAEQRRRGEIAVGWIQAALVLVFAILYFLSRKTFPLEAPFRPVPWALGIYAGFTALRLYWAYQGRLTTVLASLSVVADVAVLMLTIWSFHIQYGQPAAFYLKAPTLLYIFIFIALRTLSAAPGYVLFAGVAAASGWLALVGYAAGTGGGDVVTRDYVAYMNAPLILIGGEVDKIISILLVATVLAFAAARSRELLYQSVAQHAAATQLARFFSPEVAETIVRADEALAIGAGRHTEAAAMFIDMRGFTRLVAVPIIQSHSGSIVTYLGDGIMVTFGAIRPSGRYAADALRATEALLDALHAWAAARARAGLPAPGVGIGVYCGTVTCGAIGSEGRLEYAVIGDPVNRAAKLQNHTKAEGVAALTTLATRERAIAQGYDAARADEVRSDRQVAGIDGTLELVVIE